MPLKSSQIEFRFASCHVDSCGVVALTDTSISVGLIHLSSLHECPKNLLNCSRNLSSKLKTALSFRRVLKPLFLPFPPIKALRPLMIQLIIPCFSCGMAYVPTVVQSHSDKHSLAIFYLRALSGSQNWRAWPWPVSMVTYLFIMLSIFLIFGLSLTSHENLNSNFRNRYGVFFQCSF